jgi:hypothetical protein
MRGSLSGAESYFTASTMCGCCMGPARKTGPMPAPSWSTSAMGVRRGMRATSSGRKASWLPKVLLVRGSFWKAGAVTRSPLESRATTALISSLWW